jgi:hypothetical protein
MEVHTMIVRLWTNMMPWKTTKVSRNGDEDGIEE